MKFIVIAATAIAALTTTASAEKCVYAEISDQLHALGATLFKCEKSVKGVVLTTPKEPFTASQHLSICQSAHCEDFLKDVSKQTWPKCTLSLAGKEQSVQDYMDSLTTPCKGVKVIKDSASSSSASNTSAPTTGSQVKCVYAEVSAPLHAMAESLADCTGATGVNVARPKVELTAEEKKKVCESEKCKKFISEVTSQKWPTCTLNFEGKEQPIQSYFDSITKCSGSAVAAPAAGATTPVASTPAASSAVSVTVGHVAAVASAAVVAMA